MVELEINDDTAYLKLYPEKQFNILEPHKIREIHSRISSLKNSPAKVLIIKGYGGSFAVGANIMTMLEYSGYTAKGFSMLGNKLFRLMDKIPQIIIAEIDGFCMGGGMDFASACDFRLATNRSKFAHPGSKLGIITGFGGTQRISRLMYSTYFTEHILTGNSFSAEFMKKSGFLLRTFGSDREMEKASGEMVKNIINKNRFFLGELKDSVNKQR